MNSTTYNNKKKAYYLNGNYFVFYSYREKVYKRCLRIDEDLIADFPDSIDLKITNKCSHNCPYCHENSVCDGSSFNFDHTIDILKQLPKVPIEIAIGGGNVLDIPKDTLRLIHWCNDYGFKTRITINQKDLEKFNIRVPKGASFRKVELTADQIIMRNIGSNVGGVGISLIPELLPEIDLDDYFPNYKLNILCNKILGEEDKEFDVDSALRGKRTVFHIIAGIFPIDKLKMLLNKQYLQGINSLLILGYKQFGRAKDTKLPESLPEFESIVKEFITRTRNDYMNTFDLAFDNLALEQLHLKEFITEDEWDRLYLGKEGNCSMYIDAVNETYAKSSTSINRVSWKDVGLLEFFKSLRNENNN